MRTLDAGRPIAEAVAVAGGRVLAVGSRAALRPLVGPSTARVDCRRATVLPGLLDPHLHLFALAARHVHLDCAGMTDVPGVLAAVRARARELPPGAWLRGDGLDEVCLGRLPTAQELDAAAPEHPVRLRHRSLHASVLSGRALRLLGRVPGRFPNGLVSGREDLLARVVGPLPAGDFARGLAAAGRYLAALGFTTVAEATPRTWRGLAPLRQVMGGGGFPLRVHAMQRAGTPAWQPAGRLHPGPIKIMIEEGAGGLRPRPATLAHRIAAAAASGGQVAVHCVGAATLVAALAAFAALPRGQRAGRRHRLEHLAECPPSLVARIAALGLVVVTNPAFVHWRGDVYRHETPPSVHSWLYRARTLAAAGVPLAAASDAPVVPPSPWVGMAAARTRRTRAGHALAPAERLGAAAALRLYTTGAAFALGADPLGRLVPGGPADLVVVEPDPVVAGADEVAASRVVLTLVAGRQAWPT